MSQRLEDDAVVLVQPELIADESISGRHAKALPRVPELLFGAEQLRLFEDGRKPQFPELSGALRDDGSRVPQRHLARKDGHSAALGESPVLDEAPGPLGPAEQVGQVMGLPVRYPPGPRRSVGGLG